MPFTKIGKNQYRKKGEKNGKIWTLEQIRAYHANKRKRLRGK